MLLCFIKESVKTMKKICKVITIFIVAVFTVVHFSPLTVFADSFEETTTYITSDMAYSFSDLNDIAKRSWDVKNEQEVNNYKQLAIASLSNIILHSDVENLNVDDVRVVKTLVNGSEYTSVNFGIKGSYSLLSNLNLLFDSNNKLEYYTETLITRNQTNTFNIQVFANGSLLEEKKTDIPYLTNTQIREGLEGLKSLKYERENRDVWEIAGCIAAVAGVNGLVAKLIAGTCVAACTAAPIGGVVCAACIGGVCAIGAADIAAIVSCFKL